MLAVIQLFISSCYDLTLQSLVCCPTLHMLCVWTLSALGRSSTCTSQNHQKTIRRLTSCWRYVVKCRCCPTCLLRNCLVHKQTRDTLWTFCRALNSFGNVLSIVIFYIFITQFEPLNHRHFSSLKIFSIWDYGPVVVTSTVLTVIASVVSFLDTQLLVLFDRLLCSTAFVIFIMIRFIEDLIILLTSTELLLAA